MSLRFYNERKSCGKSVQVCSVAESLLDCRSAARMSVVWAKRQTISLRHSLGLGAEPAAQRIYCAILICGSESRALRKAPFIRKAESYTVPVLGKRHRGCGGLEPLSHTMSPTGFGYFCHQK